MPVIKIQIINGSPNKKGHVTNMVRLLAKEFTKRKANVQLINLAEYKILPHAGVLDDKVFLEETADDMPKLQRLVLEADGIVFATPTHWFNVSSLMKLFMDRLTSLEHYGFLLEGKSSGFISYGPQGGGVNAVMQMLMIANQMGMLTPPYGTIFDEGRNDKWVAKALRLLAKNMLEQIKASKNINWGFGNEGYKKSPIELIK